MGAGRSVGECRVTFLRLPVPVDPDGDANSSHTLKPKVLLSQSHGTKASARTAHTLVSARLLKSAIWRTAH